jgi:hypothetical protein
MLLFRGEKSPRSSFSCWEKRRLRRENAKLYRQQQQQLERLRAAALRGANCIIKLDRAPMCSSFVTRFHPPNKTPPARQTAFQLTSF